jgi:hypothetical protein
MEALVAKSAVKKMKDYRARLRESGLRSIQIWVPDLRSSRLESQARRQSQLASAAENERESLDFIEAVATCNDTGRSAAICSSAVPLVISASRSRVWLCNRIFSTKAMQALSCAC